MPKVFVSWSGEKSHVIAKSLHTWLPVVLQTIKPFISSEDLSKGSRWNVELARELEKESFGVICLTPTNLTAPWILFEAGALSKSVGESQVAPFLVGVKPSELPSPLTQFNAVQAEREDFKKLIRAINLRNDLEKVPDDTIDRSVDACWPRIEDELRQAVEPPVSRSAEDRASFSDSAVALEKFDAILQELLILNRSQTKILNDPEGLFPREMWRELRHAMRGADVPSSGHAVWRDLFQSVDILEEFTVKDGDISPVVRSAIDNLSKVSNYLRRRLGPPTLGSVPYSSARSRSIASEPNSLPLQPGDQGEPESP